MGDAHQSKRLHAQVQSAIRRVLSRIRHRPCRSPIPRTQGTPGVSPHLDVRGEVEHIEPTRKELALSKFGPFMGKPADTTYVYAQDTVKDCKPLLDAPLCSSIRVPLEVQEYIIGFLGSGSTSALGAALICRAWYLSAITLFYEEVEISTRRSFDQLVRLACNNTRVRRQLATTRYISFRDQTCIPTFPLVLGAVLPSLSSLSISELRGPLHPTFFTALYQLSSITHLRLTAAWIYNFHQLRRLISALRNLIHLDIGDVTPLQVSDGAQTSTLHSTIFTPIPVRLQTLVLNVSSSVRPVLLVELIDWLVRTSICESLTALTLYGPPRIRRELAEQMGLLLQAAGSSLRMLKNPYFSVSTPNLPFPIVNYDLSRNISLVHLNFKLHALHWNALVDELCSILSSIRSPSLADIKMLYNWEPTELRGLPVSTKFNMLHAVMESAAYNNLTHVELNITVVDAFLERYAYRERREHELEAGLRALFAPWDERLGESFTLRTLW